MQKEIFEIINKHISLWNILNVSIDIAQFEYQDFVPLIKDAIDKKNGAMDKIDSYLIDLIGFGFENPKVFEDTNEIIKTILNELKIKGLYS